MKFYLFLILAVTMFVTAVGVGVSGAQEDSKNIYNGSTPVDLQRLQDQSEITRLRGELSNSNQTNAVMKMVDGVRTALFSVGAMLVFVIVGFGIFLYSKLSGQIGLEGTRLSRQVEDESTEIKGRYDRHIDPNAQANREAATANTENTRLMGYRDTFQTRELGTAPVGQPNTGQFAVPSGFKLVASD